MPELRLFVRGPGGQERVYDITQDEVEVGRDPAVAVPVADRTLSRQHCRIYRGVDGWRITDLGSRNGTFLNGRPILDELLATGDRVEIGETRMSVVLSGEGMESLVPDLDAMTTRATPRDARGRDAHQERQREIRALRHLIELNEKINALEDEDTLLDGVLDAAIELTRAGRGLLLLEAGDHFVVRRARLPQQRDLADPEGSFSVSIAASVVREGKSVLSEDARMDARFQGTASVATLELRSLVCVPLRTPGGVIGAIYLDNRYEHGTFDGWDVRVLEGFAGLAGIALQNARQRREMAQRRREAVRQARRIERLNDRLRKALRIRTNALRRAREDLAKQSDDLGLRYSYDQIVGRSQAMRGVLRLVDRVTDLDIPVLILGESGTGKELIARAIHFNGPRRRTRLVSESCAAIPTNLMESEFFGYVRGAFTGANRDHEGLFEQADQGTMFLDEVGELPLEIQGKLLRVLEEREVRRIGSKKVRTVDVRLISATNRDLQERIATGAFREDLYYRLAGLVIELPALRDRKEDIPLLAAHFLQEAVGPEGKPPRMDPGALALLTAYEWPGNVRELRNELHRLVAIQVGGTIMPEHLSQRILDYRPPTLEAPTPGGLKGMVEDLERRVLRATLLRHGWNKSRTAAELGLSRLGLRKKLERYGMDAEQPPEA